MTAQQGEARTVRMGQFTALLLDNGKTMVVDMNSGNVVPPGTDNKNPWEQVARMAFEELLRVNGPKERKPRAPRKSKDTSADVSQAAS